MMDKRAGVPSQAWRLQLWVSVEDPGQDVPPQVRCLVRVAAPQVALQALKGPHWPQPEVHSHSEGQRSGFWQSWCRRDPEFVQLGLRSLGHA